MAGPPNDVPPTELWAKITAIPRPHKLVDLPRKDPATGESVGQIAMWPLTQEEQMIASAAAEKYVQKTLKELHDQKLTESFGYQSLYSNESCVQILHFACREIDDLKRPAFPSPKLMRSSFTADEIGALFRHYMTVQTELGPIVAHMSEDEMEAWVKRLHEGGQMYPFDLLASEAQNQFLRFLVSRTYNSLMGTTSLGSPPDEQPSASDESGDATADDDDALPEKAEES